MTEAEIRSFVEVAEADQKALLLRIGLAAFVCLEVGFVVGWPQAFASFALIATVQLASDLRGRAFLAAAHGSER